MGKRGSDSAIATDSPPRSPLQVRIGDDAADQPTANTHGCDRNGDGHAAAPRAQWE